MFDITLPEGSTLVSPTEMLILAIHEPAYLVRGDRTPLAPGMCFSNEPMIVVPERFGVRLEDCIHLTPQGPKWFSEPPKSLDKPMG